MTHLALRPPEPSALERAGDALGRLGEWVNAAGHAESLVTMIIDTPFVPDSYRPKIDPRATPQQKADARAVAIANGTAAVLQGITLGLNPLTALQQIYIVHGRPGMYAKLMVALVQSHGHEVWTEDQSDHRAVVCGRRNGSDHTERVTVTMDQARRAGWTRNEAYTKTPQDMLWARAAGRVCDRIGSDALKGIAVIEEIDDDAAANDTRRGTRTISRRRTPAAVTAAEEPYEDSPAAPVAITQAQQRRLHALLRERDMADREVALRWIGETVGRDVQSTKDLTGDEATIAIETLQYAAAQAAADNDAEPERPALDESEPWPEVTQPGGTP